MSSQQSPNTVRPGEEKQIARLDDEVGDPCPGDEQEKHAQATGSSIPIASLT